MRKWLLTASLAGIIFVNLWENGPALEAKGILAGYALDTTVDHKVAEAYIAGRALPRPLADLRQAHLSEGTIPTREELAQVTSAYSVDTAALLFVETVAAQEENQRVRAEYEKAFEAVRGNRPVPNSVSPSLLVLFVPGWLYQVNGEETGSAFVDPRRLLASRGIETRLASTDQNGSVEENAAVVAGEIRAAGALGRQLVVVSASKSGAEVSLALGQVLAPGETSHVRAWVSIGGVLRGSPVADRIVGSVFCSLVRAKLAFDGFDMHGLLSMQTPRQRERFDQLQLPGHVLYLSYIPVPLSGDMSRRGQLFYQATKAAGPGDGFTLLADELIPAGLVLLEPGVDHFLEHPDKDLRTEALFRVVMNRLGFSQP